MVNMYSSVIGIIFLLIQSQIIFGYGVVTFLHGAYITGMSLLIGGLLLVTVLSRVIKS